MNNNAAERSLFSRLSGVCTGLSFLIRTTISMGNRWNYIWNNWFIGSGGTKNICYYRSNNMPN